MRSLALGRIARVGLAVSFVVVGCTAERSAPTRTATIELPPNTQLDDGHTVVCKPGYVTEPGREGCVPPAPTGHQDVTVSDLPGFRGNERPPTDANPPATIRSKCAEAWPGNFVMQESCIKAETDAYNRLQSR